MKLVLVLLLLSVIQTGFAKITEDVVDLEVTVTDKFGRRISGKIPVTIFWNSGVSEKLPFLVLNHGRGTALERAEMGRARYSANSGYFVSKGFVVLVPTRMGYGAAGGEDVEDAESCSSRADIEAVFEAAAQQTLKVVEYARALPQVNPEKGLLVGQSFGGATTIAALAKNIAGVIAGVNFAGGTGGDVKNRPKNPCGYHLVQRAYAKYGATAKRPSLWIYAENDLFWGDRLPKRWFDAFSEQGGNGKFIMLPPMEATLGPDGHSTFTRDVKAWRPAFESFLKELHF